jgi:hypothetical protein
MRSNSRIHRKRFSETAWTPNLRSVAAQLAAFFKNDRRRRMAFGQAQGELVPAISQTPAGALQRLGG